MLPPATLELHPPEAPRATVIVLHGLGADGTDFLPIADEIDLAGAGPVRWLFPRAPMRPVTINNGAVMRAWYDILGTDLVRREDEAGLRESFAAVHALLEREHSRGMPAAHIVLAGFSQGAAIALGAGLRHAQRLAGIAGLSGYLPLAEATAAERQAANAMTPVFLGHGSHDGVVAVSRGQASRERLAALGHAVQWQEYPIEHSVCLEEVQALQQWLRLRLAPG